MKYTDATASAAPFDLDRKFGDVLVRAGLIKVYTPPVAIKKADTSWGIARFTDGTPYVTGTCRSCANKYTIATTDLSRLTAFGHCGIQELVPADVVAEYKSKVEAFAPKAPVERKPERVFLNI